MFDPCHLVRGCACSALVGAVLLAASSAGGDVLTLVSSNEEGIGHFGHSLSAIPDIDGDGLDDLIVGAPKENGGGVADAGRVYVFSGATGQQIRAHSSPNDSLNGAYGFAVAGVQDLTGDGRGDYVVGAPGEPGGGRVYVYSGATGALVDTLVSTTPVAGGEFGAALAGVDDINGDGRGEYIIGAPGETASGLANAGRIYLINGQAGTALAVRTSIAAELGGRFGAAVAGIPDFDADGRGDFAVGAPFEDPGALPIDAGRAYVYTGLNAVLEHTLVSGNPQASGRFGSSIAGVPDVGGFGGGDVIVGAPYEDVLVPALDLFPAAGRAYLFSGTGGFLAHTYREPDQTIAANGLFGHAVSGMPDVNGDGLGDVIVGAPSWPSYRAIVIAADSAQVVAMISSPDALGADQFWGGAVAGIRDANGDGLGDYAVGGRGADDAPAGPSNAGRVTLHRPLKNDTCNSISDPPPYMFDGPNAFTTIGATEGNADPGCFQFANPGPDVWFRYSATCTGTLTISTCAAANFNTKLAAYGGCGLVCSISTLLGCNDNAPPIQGCGGGGTSVLEVPVESGLCYRIRVGGASGESGMGILTLTCTACNSADLDGDGTVGASDLAVLLGAWGAGPCRGAACDADLDGDGSIGAADLAILLGAWGEGCN